MGLDTVARCFITSPRKLANQWRSFYRFIDKFPYKKQGFSAYTENGEDLRRQYATIRFRNFALLLGLCFTATHTFRRI
jgi:hypothetical protein